MIRPGLHCSVLAALLVIVPGTKGAVPNATSDFKEVYELVRSNLAGVTDADLDRAAVDGLVTGFDGRILLEGDQKNGATNATLASTARTIEEGIGYLRVSRVAEGLARELTSVMRDLTATNPLKGLVLDLRFARGSDFAAAVATADLFVTRERPLLDWGNGVVRAQAKTNALTLPLAVLINSNTLGAAEALAAVLRESGSGLLLGNTTAGRAMVMRDFPLKNGQRLRIAVRPVKLGDGTEISTDGVKADIDVAVNPADERAWFDDPYATLGRTNLPNADGQIAETPRRPRLNEAQLVRERKGRVDPEIQPAPRPVEPEKPLIRDPVLARAVDLLKALAVVRDAHD